MLSDKNQSSLCRYMHYEYRHHRLTQIREHSERRTQPQSCSLSSHDHSKSRDLRRVRRVSTQLESSGHFLLDSTPVRSLDRPDCSHTKSGETEISPSTIFDSHTDCVGNSLPMTEEHQDRRVSTVPELPEPERSLQSKISSQRQNKWNTFTLFRPSLITAQSSDIAAQAHVDEPSDQRNLALQSLARFDIRRTDSCHSDILASDSGLTGVTEQSQEASTDASFNVSPDSVTTIVPLPASERTSEERAEPSTEQDTTKELEEETEQKPNLSIGPETELTPDSELIVEEPLDPEISPATEKDEPVEESFQTTNSVPAIHIHGPSSAIDLPTKSDDETAKMANVVPDPPLASPTTLDLNSVRALSSSEERLPGNTFTLPQPMLLGTNPLADKDLVPSSIPVSSSHPIPLPTIALPDLPLERPSKRKRLVQRARKLLLRKRVLKLLLGRELGDVAYDQVKLSQTVSQSVPIPGLDGSAPSSSMRCARRPGYRVNPRIMSPELAASGPRITWESSAAPSVQSTPRIRPRQQSIVSAQSSRAPLQAQPHLPPRPQQHVHVKTPLRLQQNAPKRKPTWAMSRQERRAARDERKQLKRSATLRKKEDKCQRKEARNQQKYRTKAEKLQRGIEQELKQSEREIQPLPKCTVCGRRAPSLLLTKYLSIKQRSNQLDTILKRDRIPEALHTAVNGSMTMQHALALRQQYECSCTGQNMVSPGPSHAPPVADSAPGPSTTDCEAGSGENHDREVS